MRIVPYAVPGNLRDGDVPHCPRRHPPARGRHRRPASMSMLLKTSLRTTAKSLSSAM